jgi:gas vesicle protein
MSEHQNVTVVSLISFAVGLLVGAIVTMFLAPMSGRELRGQIHDHAQADWQRVSDQMHRTQAEMRQQLDSMRQQMAAYDQQVREQITDQFNQLQTKINKQTAADTAATGDVAGTTAEQGA